MESFKTRCELAGPKAARPGALPFAKLGDCRIIRRIGRGGMGVVFEAVQEPIGRKVAVKLLPGRFPATSRWRKRFCGEAQTAARMQHHHVVPVYSFGEQDGWCYFTMQLIEGIGLDKIIGLLCEPRGAVFATDIRRLFAPADSVRDREAAPADLADPSEMTPAARTRGVLRRDSWVRFAKIGMQAAAALRYAHSRGILHRDVKPGNLLLDCRGSVWVADFGVSATKSAVKRYGADRLGGTRRYLAPEQFLGVADERSDVYALGVTLYELCTLRPAFDADDRDELLKQIGQARPRKPRAINRRVPRDLERVILKAMAYDPARRFQSAAEMLTALRAVVRDGGAGWLAPIRRFFRRRR